MIEPLTPRMRLLRERHSLLRLTVWTYDKCIALVERAEAEHLADNIPEAKILLHEALDLEYKISGSTNALRPLAEAWGTDYLKDRR